MTTYKNIVNRDRLDYFFDQIYDRYLRKAASSILKINIGNTPYPQKNGIVTLPEDQDTTYGFVGGVNKFTVTSSTGSTQDIVITPSIDNNVTGADLDVNKIVIGSGSSNVKTSDIGISVSLDANSDLFVPTSKAVASYVAGQLVSALRYKGTIGSSNATVTALPASHAVGDVYVVKTNGTYAGKAAEVGDYIICNTAGDTANDAHWDVINGENQVSNKAVTLAWGASRTIATVDGTDITVTLPSNPNTDTDTKVTSVENHYAPVSDPSAQLTATLSGTAGEHAVNTEYTVLTGIKVQRDAKGHVTGVTYTAQKIKDTDSDTITTISYVSEADIDTIINSKD